MDSIDIHFSHDSRIISVSQKIITRTNTEKLYTINTNLELLFFTFLCVCVLIIIINVLICYTLLILTI